MKEEVCGGFGRNPPWFLLSAEFVLSERLLSLARYQVSVWIWPLYPDFFIRFIYFIYLFIYLDNDDCGFSMKDPPFLCVFLLENCFPTVENVKKIYKN